MRIYLSDLSLEILFGIRSKLDENFNPHILMPYDHRIEKSNIELSRLIDKKHMFKSLMIDSGTFVMNQEMEKKNRFFNYREQFNLYKHFIHQESSDFDYFINFDVEFNGDMSLEVNKVYQEELENNGFSPIFVIHSLKRNEIDYILTRSNKPELVAIASARLKNNNEFALAQNIVNELYQNGIKVHLLGCNSFKKLSQTKAWSCDASSYARWSGLKKVIYYSDIAKREIVLSLSKYNKKGQLNKTFYNNDSMLVYKHEYERIIGISIDEIIENDINVLLVNAYYMWLLEERITDMQKKDGITFDKW